MAFLPLKLHILFGFVLLRIQRLIFDWFLKALGIRSIVFGILLLFLCVYPSSIVLGSLLLILLTILHDWRGVTK